jgi:hypothetical protein
MVNFKPGPAPTVPTCWRSRGVDPNSRMIRGAGEHPERCFDNPLTDLERLWNATAVILATGTSRNLAIPHRARIIMKTAPAQAGEPDGCRSGLVGTAACPG